MLQYRVDTDNLKNSRDQTDSQSSLAIISCFVSGVKLSMSRPRDASSGLMCAGTSLSFKEGAMESSAEKESGAEQRREE